MRGEEPPVGWSDCVGCLGDVRTELSSALEADEVAVFDRICAQFDAATEFGLTPSALLVRRDIRASPLTLQASFDPAQHRTVTSIVDRAFATSPPLLFWAGFDTSRIIPSTALRFWTLLQSRDDGSSIRFSPRLWTDQNGKTIADVWEQAVQSLGRTIMLNPVSTDVRPV